MSERGSYVTEYIYCDKCFEAARRILCDEVDYGELVQGLPIVAGHIRGGYSGEEIHIFENDYAEKLRAVICHPLRVAVLAESGQKVLLIHPGKPAESLTETVDEGQRHDVAAAYMAGRKSGELEAYKHIESVCRVKLQS